MVCPIGLTTVEGTPNFTSWKRRTIQVAGEGVSNVQRRERLILGETSFAVRCFQEDARLGQSWLFRVGPVADTGQFLGQFWWPEKI